MEGTINTLIRRLNETERFLGEMTRPFTIQFLENRTITGRRELQSEENSVKQITDDSEREFANGTSRLLGEVTYFYPKMAQSA